MSVKAAREALRPLSLSAWEEAGLLRVEENRSWSPVRLIPHDRQFGLWLAHDTVRVRSRAEYVMGVAPASSSLARAAIRRPAGTMLDLGTGCGLHGLLGARHCRRAVLTDVNPRAIRFARFNARLNGIENVEILGGDLLEPVAGRKFDLVLSNPPFVVSPKSEHIYADGGEAGDEICRRIVREIPAALEPGGFCQLLLNWPHPAEGEWREPLQSWFGESPCDVWVLKQETKSAADYAAEWIAATETVEPRRFADHHGDWMRFYESRNIGAVSLGLVNLRLRREGGGRFRAEEAPDLYGDCGADIERGFDRHDFLEAAAGEEQLLAAILEVAGDVRLRQSLHPHERGWAPESMQIVRTEGLGYRGDVDHFAAGLVARCDGTRRLGELIDELAAFDGSAPSVWRERILPVVRILVDQGFLVPVTRSPSSTA